MVSTFPKYSFSVLSSIFLPQKTLKGRHKKRNGTCLHLKDFRRRKCCLIKMFTIAKLAHRATRLGYSLKVKARLFPTKVAQIPDDFLGFLKSVINKQIKLVWVRIMHRLLLFGTLLRADIFVAFNDLIELVFSSRVVIFEPRL